MRGQSFALYKTEGRRRDWHVSTSENRQAKKEYQEWDSGILYITSYNQGIPWRPYWPGFIFNTIMYGVLIWAVYFARFQGFRLIRQWRGLCLKCAYDLKGAEHEVCPECGVEVRIQ